MLPAAEGGNTWLAMRIGIILLAHESNTFVRSVTRLADFQRDTLLEGEAIRERFEGGHHEVSGFLCELREQSVDAVPLLAARALPSGVVTESAFESLVSQTLQMLDRNCPLDGLLLAPHGAMVSERHRDADGFWLSEVRRLVGPDIPIVATIDPHANLSPRMVASCDAIIAYRSNPHLDQRERGRDAAKLLLNTIQGRVRPTMAARFLPLAINIERQCTEEEHWRPIREHADQQLAAAQVLSNSVVLGFPYADVTEMGTSVITVTNDNSALASKLATDLANTLWRHREQFVGQLIDVGDAMHQCANAQERICLLDMGDNVGGGSAADGTVLANALHAGRISNSFVCLHDPQAVAEAQKAGLGARLELAVGGKCDHEHGEPLRASFRVAGLCAGRFSERKVRHGGMGQFDQGPTAIVETDHGLTVMLTSKRMVPFSLEQLRGCGLDPRRFRVLVAKGVNAPVAAYREVCACFLRVNTPGSTNADMEQLEYAHRRKPLFPFESNTTWSPSMDQPWD